MFTRSGFEKPSDTPQPRRRRLSETMPGDDKKEGVAGALPVSFTAKQFEQLLRRLDEPSANATVAAEAAKASVDALQRALDILATRGPADAPVQIAANPPAAAAVTRTPDKITKLMPLFWEHQPVVWFSLLEGYFEESSVQLDAAKYKTLVPLLSPKAVTQVKNILLAPPAFTWGHDVDGDVDSSSQSLSWPPGLSVS